MSGHLVHARNLDDSLKSMILGSHLTEEEFKTFMSGYFNKNDDKMTMFNLDEEVIQYFTKIIDEKENNIRESLKEYRLKNDDIELSELNRDIIEKIENNAIDITIIKNLLSDGDTSINVNDLKSTLLQLSKKIDNFTVTEGMIQEVTEDLTEYINQRYDSVDSSITTLISQINDLNKNVRRKDSLIEESDLSQSLKDTIFNSGGNSTILDNIYRKKEDPILETDLGISLQAKLSNVTSDLNKLEEKVLEYVNEKTQEVYIDTKSDINILFNNFKNSMDELEENIKNVRKALFPKIIDITLRPNEVYKIPCENPYAYNLKILVEENDETSICYGQYVDASAIAIIGISTKESFTGYSICNSLKQSINLRIVHYKSSINDLDLYFPEQILDDTENNEENTTGDNIKNDTGDNI